MSDDEKATIVLDFNKLKQQLSQEEELVDASSLDFLAKGVDNTDQDEAKLSPKQKSNPKPLIMVDFKSDFFNKKFSGSNAKFSIVKDLNNLNNFLRSSDENVVVFYYNSAPKIINQLILQIKEKFPNNKMIIIASNLSKEKAIKHKMTKYGVDQYLSDPFGLTEFFGKLEKL